MEKNSGKFQTILREKNVLLRKEKNFDEKMFEFFFYGHFFLRGALHPCTLTRGLHHQAPNTFELGTLVGTGSHSRNHNSKNKNCKKMITDHADHLYVFKIYYVYILCNIYNILCISLIGTGPRSFHIYRHTDLLPLSPLSSKVAKLFFLIPKDVQCSKTISQSF